MANSKYFNDLFDPLARFPLMKLHHMACWSLVSYSIHYCEGSDLWYVSVDSSAPNEKFVSKDSSLSIAIDYTIEHFERLMENGFCSEYNFKRIMAVIAKYINNTNQYTTTDFLNDFIPLGGDWWFMADMGCLEVPPFHEYLLEHFGATKPIWIEPTTRPHAFILRNEDTSLVIELKMKHFNFLK